MSEPESTWQLEYDLKCAEQLQASHKYNAWGMGALSADPNTTVEGILPETTMSSDILSP